MNEGQAVRMIDECRGPEHEMLRGRVDEIVKVAESLREVVAAIETMLFGESPVEAPAANPKCPPECLDFKVFELSRTLLCTRNLAADIYNRL